MFVEVVAPGRRTAAAMAGGVVALGTVVAGISGLRQMAGEPSWATVVACT